MRILISGGGGMVGRNLSFLLKARGIYHVAPTRAQLDVLDGERVGKFIKSNKINTIIHAAGLVGGIQANIKSPYDFCMHNLQLGINLIQASLESNVDRFINLGSSCMYPYAAPNPLKESMLLSDRPEPTNEGYAIAKIAIARLTSYANQQFGCRYKTIIPCNLYGRWDRFSLEEGHMIPAVIKKIHEAKNADHSPVVIWGDGTARREFMFAEDFADSVLFLLGMYDNVADTINVGLGYDYCVNDYYRAIADVIGFQGIFEHDLTRPEGMKQKLLDTSALKALGWKPRYGLRDGVAETYKFFIEEVI